MGRTKKGKKNLNLNDSKQDWYQIVLEKSHIESGAIYGIQLQFDDFYEKASRPDGMALFLDKFTSVNSHKKRLRLFFSPSGAYIAENIINGYFGSKCVPPQKSSIDLLVGSSKAWDLL